MKTTLTVLAFIASFSLFSQDVEYFYDDAGNRIQRKICTACRTANPDSTNMDSTIQYSRNLDAGILPNPTRGALAIEVTQEGMEANEFHIYVYDIYGREIINEHHNSTTFDISISDKPPGVYFVKLITEDKIKRWEIIKE